MIVAGVTKLLAGPLIEPAIMNMVAISGGVFLILGLWTPIAGSLVAAIQLWAIFAQSGCISTSILLAALGAGLALVGPGAFSVDARLFGWKRIDFRDRKS
jgi:putative oxidoreductase